MRLVRNQTQDGKCKYALVRLDKMRLAENDKGGLADPTVVAALKLLENRGLLEYAGKGDPEEAFVIKLKDVHAPPALRAYADSAENRPGSVDKELAKDVHELADRAGVHPNRHNPDTTHITQ